MRSALSRTKARAALLQELEEAMRRSSAQGVLYGQTVANVAGIANSDLECMDILYLEGRVTAGRLAEVTGLTTGAITGVVDRLEKAGLVRRERDEQDRRKVFISVVPETAMKIGQLYVPMQQAMEKVFGAYSDEELRLLLRFATEGYKGVLAATEALKGCSIRPGKRSEEIQSKSRPGSASEQEAFAGTISTVLSSSLSVRSAIMPHIAPSIIQKCRQWSVSMTKLSPTVPK